MIGRRSRRPLDDEGAVDAARRQSHSKWAHSRAKAGEFLGQSGSPDAVGELLVLLADPEPQVRRSAARGLGRLGHNSAVSPLLASLEGPRALPVDVVADAVFEIGECRTSRLRQGLGSRSVPTRAVAVELLGRFQALAALDEVVALLHGDPSVEVRARAARALGRMGSSRAIDGLLACLDEGPVDMRVQAVWALGEIGAPQAVPALQALLVGPSRQMAEPAAVALGRPGPARPPRAPPRGRRRRPLRRGRGGRPVRPLRPGLLGYLGRRQPVGEETAEGGELLTHLV